MGSSPSKTESEAAAPAAIMQAMEQKPKTIQTMKGEEPLSTSETEYLDQLEKSIADIKSSSAPWDEQGQTIMNEILKAYFEADKKFILTVGDFLVKHKFLDVVVKIWDHCHNKDEENEHYYNSPAYKLIKIICWNYSDKCVNFCEAAYKQETAVEQCMTEFSISQTAVSDLEDSHVRYFMKATMGFLHNILRLYNANRTLVRKNSGIQRIFQYHQSAYLIIKAKVMLILAYCVNEEENEQIMTGAGVIGFIVKLLTSALESPNHVAKTYSFSAKETVMGLNKLALNDKNKLSIVKAGILPLLHKMLNDDFSLEEHSVALKCLWTLSFLKENKEPIKKEPGLLDSVRRLAEDCKNDKRIRRSCDGILFVIEGKREALKESINGRKKAQNDNHIMISYQWDTQDTILELRTMLQEQGHKVWLDVDRMEGSILSAMAEAVQNASVVVVAMTEKYKNSNPCRTESEYAYKLNKPIVFLLLQPMYKPDGWLGALLGMQLYFDISIENWREVKFPNLLQSINTKVGSSPTAVNENVTVVDAAAVGSVPPRPRTTAGRQISASATASLACRKWSKDEVAKWAKNTGVDGFASLITSFDGAALEALSKMLQRSPDVYYTSVRSEFKLTLLEMMHLTNAIENLWD